MMMDIKTGVIPYMGQRVNEAGSPTLVSSFLRLKTG